MSGRCEERLDRKRAKRLEEENRIVLDALESSRKRLEEERSKAAKSGDLQRLAASASSGRGRGRGVTNLPAWMTAQQQSPTLKQSNNEESIPNNKNKQLTQYTVDDELVNHEDTLARLRCPSSIPSCVILLNNFENKGGDNAKLEKEIKEECEKFGAVRKCVVLSCYDAGESKTEDVKVLVHFERQDGAIKAVRELHFRFFDGRRITATFYDEEVFSKEVLCD